MEDRERKAKKITIVENAKLERDNYNSSHQTTKNQRELGSNFLEE